eukprot:m.238562 g.238562  ORF g.238562 m.238562 type:complete len:392 (-) comp15806_c0_seq12:1120-2295(-)
MGQLRLQSLGRRAGQQRLVVTSLALQILSPFPPLTLATPVPPPGPKCALNANPDGSCPNGALYVHNASCVGEAGADWVIKPNYHPGSACHGENDPNGPMFYNGVYHLFFQDHVPMQVGGHLATRDFVHWARLPIALWNDRWYDQEAVWTFSATIVDGTPNLVYPGIAGKNTSLSPCGKSGGCFTHSIAVPANLSDPFLTDWTKPDFNPTLTNHMSIESRDPSTAWQTPDGEWRYMDAAADIYSSWDFRSFRNVGNLEGTAAHANPTLSHEVDACLCLLTVMSAVHGLELETAPTSSPSHPTALAATQASSQRLAQPTSVPEVLVGCMPLATTRTVLPTQRETGRQYWRAFLLTSAARRPSTRPSRCGTGTDGSCGAGPSRSPITPWSFLRS